MHTPRTPPRARRALPTRPRAAAAHRARRSGAAVAALAVALPALLVGAPGAADAAGTRSAPMSLACTPSTITVGSTTSCTVTLVDTAPGTKSAPDGTVSLAVTTPGRTSSMFVVTPCRLAAESGRQSGCAGVRAVLLGTGVLTVQAVFTPTAADNHRAATATQTIAVAASANPVLYTPAWSSLDGRSLPQGAPFALFGAGCNQAGGTWGQFVGYDRDPLVETDPNRMVQSLQVATRADGSLLWIDSVPPDAGTGRFFLRFYCAAAAIDSIGDARIVWLGPVVDFTVEAGTDVAAALVTAAATGDPTTSATATTTATAAPATTTRTLTVDPDALAGVDRVGLTGDQAAALKVRVDAARAGSGRLTRLAVAALGRMPDRALVDRFAGPVAGGDTSGLQAALAGTGEFRTLWAGGTADAFVRRAYATVLGRAPSATELSTAVGRLSARTVTRIGLLATLVEVPSHVLAVAHRTDVLATYQAVTTTMPTAADLARFTRQLADTRSRVQVVEDVALARAGVAAWTRALTGPSGGTARL